MDNKQKLEILGSAYDCQRGSLWWGAESFISERFAHWHLSGRKGHPLLSLRKQPIRALCDIIPMLVGTSAERGRLLIQVTADRTTDFATHLESRLIFADDFLFHRTDQEITRNPTAPVWKRRHIWPNFPKTHITQEEDQQLRRFLAERKTVALDRGGYEQ